MPLFNPTQQLNLNYAGLMSSANDSADTATKIFQNLATQHQANQDKTKAEYSKFNTNALISKIQGIDTSLTLGQQQQKRQDILDSIGSNHNLNFDTINQVVNNSVKYGQDVFNKKRAFDETVKQNTATNNYRSNMLKHDIAKTKIAGDANKATARYQQAMLRLKENALKFKQDNSPIALKSNVNNILHNSIETSKDVNGNTVKTLNIDKFNAATANFPAEIVKGATDSYKSVTGINDKIAVKAKNNERNFKIATKQADNLFGIYQNLQNKVPKPTPLTAEQMKTAVETFGDNIDWFKTFDSDRSKIRPAIQAMVRAGKSYKEILDFANEFSGPWGLNQDNLIEVGNNYNVSTLNAQNTVNEALNNYNNAMNALKKGNQ